MSLTTTTRSHQLVPAVFLALVLMSACSGDQEVPTASAPAPVVVDQEQGQVQDNEDDVNVEEPVDQDVEEPAETDVTALQVGDTVPSEKVNEARSAGITVFVPVNGDDGEAVVVEPGTLPDVVREDL